MTALNDLRSWVAFVSLLGTGLIAGLFFVFSVAIMRALLRLPDREGAAAMQSINVVIVNPIFLSVFLGTALASAVALGLALARWSQPDTVFLLSGGLAYLIGSFLVTIAFNVPRNNALAATAPDDPNLPSVWRTYATSWTAWNHVRTLASLASTALFALALAQ